MKKATLFVIVISVLFMVGFSLEEKVFLKESIYTRNGIYERPFEMWYADTSLCHICIDKVVAKEEAKEIAQTILNKLTVMNDRFELDNKIIIYIVEDDSINIPYRIGNSVVITFDSIEKGIYDEAILSAYFSCSEEWILRGLKESLFGKPVAKNELTSFYEDKNNIKNLHFTPWTFTEFYNKEDLKLAENTAAYFLEYLEDEYGKSKLLELYKNPRDINEILGSDYSKLKNEWLRSIGVENEYAYEYDNFFDNLFCVEKDEYLSIVGTDVRYDIHKEIFKTTDEVDLFIYRNITGREKAINLVKEHGKDNRTIRHDIDIHYLLLKANNYESYISWMDPHGVSLLDTEPNAHIHEAVHLYIASYLSPLTEIWLHEGMCEYFDMLYGEYNREASYEVITKKFNERSFLSSVRKYYLDRGGKLDSLSVFDYPLYVDALAYISLKNPIDSLQYFVYFESVYNIKMDKDKNLTYPQAASLVAYMINTYSLEDVLTICGNYNYLESITGKSFSDIHSEWKEYLSHS